MSDFSPQQKHSILTHYQHGVRGRGFQALSLRFAVNGGSETIRYWYKQWNGTPQSLETKPRSGRPRLLTTRQVQQHIRKPILDANRHHRTIHYTDLTHSIHQSTDTQVSLQTIRRYGKEVLGARNKRTRKRTIDECQSIHTLRVE